jgi:flagella synthesis protein FlgN
VNATGGDARLARVITDELATLREFVQLLQKEQEALADGDIDALMPLSTKKTSLSVRLGQFSEQRHEILAAAAFSRDRAGMEDWLARLTQNSSTALTSRNEWEDLLALAAEARALNETNGKLIGTRLQHNQQALNALLAAGNQAALYGPDGQTRTGGSGRLFGSA